MAKIIAIVNQKGGVGKTTTAINLSTCVAEKGKKTLLIDIDPQGNATSGLGINSIEKSVYDVLISGVSMQEVIKPTMVKNLFVCPADVNLAGAEVELVNVENREHRLNTAINNLEQKYDYIFIDCPPSLRTYNFKRICSSKQCVGSNTSRVLCVRRTWTTCKYN